MTAKEPTGSTVEYTLGRIDGKIDMLLARDAERQTQIDDQDKRISALEKGRAWLLGASATVAAGLSAAGTIFLR
jgi:hypothetical protein